MFCIALRVIKLMFGWAGNMIGMGSDNYVHSSRQKIIAGEWK